MMTIIKFLIRGESFNTCIYIYTFNKVHNLKLGITLTITKKFNSFELLLFELLFEHEPRNFVYES